MKRDYWTGSHRAWRASAAYAGRNLGDLDANYGPGTVRSGYFALAAAFVTVAAGSVGATVLAMSLMAGDPPGRTVAPEAAVRASVASASAASVPPIKLAEATPAAQAPTESQSTNPVVPEAKPADAAVASADPVPPAAPAAMPQPSESAEGSMQAGHDSPAEDEDVAALEAGDPRWAQGAAPAPSIETLRDQDGGEAQAFDNDAIESGEATAAVGRAVMDDEADDGQDPAETAAIAPPPRQKEPAKVAAGGRSTVLNTDSNMRSSPNKTARVIGTVPARAVVQLVGCKSWCEIIYKGKRGFVYSGFVDKGSGGAKTSSIAARQKVAIQPKAAKTGESDTLPGVQSSELPKLPAAQAPHSENRGG